MIVTSSWPLARVGVGSEGHSATSVAVNSCHASALVVSTARTGLAKSFRGGFNATHGAVLGGHVIKSAVEKIGLEPEAVEDVIMGTLPFFIIILAFMLLLIAFPQIALFLPEFTFG